MPPSSPMIASWSFTTAPSAWDGVHRFVTDHSQILAFFNDLWTNLNHLISRPDVYPVIIAWAVTFTVIVFLLLSLGFGPIGVVAGSAAAAFQAWMYGGFTPAAGVFATLTSLGMLGLLMPAVMLFAAMIASVVAAIVWLFVRGA